MNYLERLRHNSYLYIGYPPATDFKLSGYAELLDYSMNSLGNPYDLSNPFSSHAHEKAVIDFFMDMYNLEKNDYWGYIANCSTESILYCIWKAKEYLHNHNKPIKIICNNFSHYSIDKVSEILDIELMKISTNSIGEINYHELEYNLDETYSYIFFATVGSTITSTIDDVTKIKQLFKARKIIHYIHADGAFDGAFLPFTNDFCKINGFDSINISGHKFIGSPMPSGITIIKQEYVKGNYIEIVSNDDITIGGSRNGLVPYLLYKRIQQIGGAKGMKNRYLQCLANAEKYFQILTDKKIKSFKLSNAITIVLSDIPKEVMKKWHAPTKGNLTTLTVLPKLDENKLDEFIKDLKDHEKGIFKLELMKTEMPCIVDAL